MIRLRKIMRTMLLLLMAISLMIPSASVLAKSKKVTDAQLKKVMKCYDNILANDPYKDMDGGFSAKSFLLKDLDKDGIPELIINDEAPQIFSYNLENEEEIFLYNSWVKCTFYYSAKAKTLLYTYSWNGKKDWFFYKINNVQENDIDGILSGYDDYYTYTDGKYEEGSYTTAKKGYYKGYYGSDDAKKVTKATVDAAIKKYVPDKVKLETTIKNTKENRKKYLSSLKQFKKSI